MDFVTAYSTIRQHRVVKANAFWKKIRDAKAAGTRVHPRTVKAAKRWEATVSLCTNRLISLGSC